MEPRWLMLAFGLLFTALTVDFVRRGDFLLAGVGAVHAVFALGGFWWNTTQETPIETRFSRSR